MNKILVLILAGLVVLAACAPAQATPNVVPMFEIGPTKTVTPSATPQTWTPTPEPCPTGWHKENSVCVKDYTRPEASVGNTACSLSDHSGYTSVIFFTDTGDSVCVLESRGTRELKLGTDIPMNTVAVLIFDENDEIMPRNEIVQVPTGTIELRIDNGGLLVTNTDWKEYLPVEGFAFEDAIMAMREAGLDRLADSIRDNRSLADAGQLCLESGKEISSAFPCHRPGATMIP